MRGIRITALALLLIVAAACGLGKTAAKGSSGGLTPALPSATPQVTPTGATHVVTGTALDASNNAISGVAVGLKASTASATCSTCGFYSGVTSALGVYSIVVPDGVYVGACNAGTKLTCRFSDLPNDATVKVTVSGADLTANLIISAPDSAPSPAQQNDSGTTISGHVYTSSGKPVAGATVEFREEACPNCMPQPWTTTNSHGAYSINVNAGVYNAECPEPFNCSVKGGNGGPFPVTVPPNQTVDFVVRN